MKFTKMHGLGNDYVYVNCLEEKIKNPAKLAQIISDRLRFVQRRPGVDIFAAAFC